MTDAAPCDVVGGDRKPVENGTRMAAGNHVATWTTAAPGEGETVKAMGGILPWTIVLAAIGGATWWALSHDMAAGRWLLAAVLLGHGIVHVMFAVPTPAATAGAPEWPFDMAHSWAVTGAGLDLGVVRLVGAVLIVIVAVGFALAALSTAGFVVPAGWWQACVGVSAVASVAMLALFFESQLVLGLGIDAVLLWAVLTRAWAPG